MTVNPFELLNERLDRIEASLREIKTNPSPRERGEEMPVGVIKAAEITGLSVPTIYTKVSRRTIPAHRQAGRLYFFESELLAWIRSGRRKMIKEIESDAIHSLEESK